MKLVLAVVGAALLVLSGCATPTPNDPIGGKLTIARQSALIANGGYVGGPAN